MLPRQNVDEAVDVVGAVGRSENLFGRHRLRGQRTLQPLEGLPVPVLGRLQLQQNVVQGGLRGVVGLICVVVEKSSSVQLATLLVASGV